MSLTGVEAVTENWESELDRKLALFGHRNWIVIADAAYPAQSQPGIETILTGADHLHVIRRVLQAIADSVHVRPKAYTDLELAYLSEDDLPGVSEYRRELKTLLHGTAIQQLPHEKVIEKLDHFARVFRILILKTEMTIPYSSVFFELDCAYWDAAAEERLRTSMEVPMPSQS